MMTLEEAFNEWMRQYTKEPEKFRRQWQDVTQFFEESLRGETPSYGARCVKMLEGIMGGSELTVTLQEEAIDA